MRKPPAARDGSPNTLCTDYLTVLNALDAPEVPRIPYGQSMRDARLRR
jgi:hypothetical protein